MVYDSTFGYRYRGDPAAWNGWRQYLLNGEVDDGNSFYANGGIAGHPGPFSTAAEGGALLHLLNDGRSYRRRPALPPHSIGRPRYLRSKPNHFRQAAQPRPLRRHG